MKVRYRVTVEGVVQGVGFRPFVYRLAQEGGLRGYVTNTPRGVEMEVEGKPEAVAAFFTALTESPPPAARLIAVKKQAIPPKEEEEGWVIRESILQGKRSALIPPDVATCAECLQELRDPGNRRYRYPFINCTHCGPRYTIIRDIPYDRPQTTMASFALCPACAAEYHSPQDRRFHAQANACPQCGPRIFLYDREGRLLASEDPIGKACALLAEGYILAVKGLGGFHLAVDALREEAVQSLRRRKHRAEKPFALMTRNLQTLSAFAYAEAEERRLLESRERPIVLLRKKEPNPIASSVAPGNRYFGVMLPYTPLHHLMMDYGFVALVMTSGNLSEEPICRGNEEAFSRLRDVADFFLVHNRDIHTRCDDSIIQTVGGKPRSLRRSRGYVPVPIFWKEPLKPILACGAEQKNTVCLTKGNRAFLSQHIGDLDHWETLDFFRETVEHLQRILDIEPEIVAHDLHPDYLSTRFALEQQGVRLIAVQHHFAHMVSCMAENGLTDEVIGLTLDGSGYGLDGCIWGGEVLIGDCFSFERMGHFDYVPMPGGAQAIREPWRMAVGYLYQAFGEDFLRLPFPFLKRRREQERGILLRMIERRINTPLTSSCGRLFDGVAALLGVRESVSFEGQAAMELEMLQDRSETSFYPVDILRKDGRFLIPPATIIQAVVEDIENKIPAPRIIRRFHLTLLRTLVALCRRLRQERGTEKVVLSGGVFQNRIFLQEMDEKLRQEGFQVFTHSLVPANDGGIALGQAVAAHYLDRRFVGESSPRTGPSAQDRTKLSGKTR